jgi:hypothetical protein
MRYNELIKSCTSVGVVVDRRCQEEQRKQKVKVVSRTRSYTCTSQSRRVTLGTLASPNAAALKVLGVDTAERLHQL